MKDELPTRLITDDRLILIDLYFKLKDKPSRISHHETRTRLLGDEYCVSGKHLDENKLRIDPFFYTPIFNPDYSRRAFDPFIFHIPKSRASKQKPLQELDNDKLYFLIADMANRPTYFHTEVRPTFLLWLNLEESVTKPNICPAGMSPRETTGKLASFDRIGAQVDSPCRARTYSLSPPKETIPTIGVTRSHRGQTRYLFPSRVTASTSDHTRALNRSRKSPTHSARLWHLSLLTKLKQQYKRKHHQRAV